MHTGMGQLHQGLRDVTRRKGWDAVESSSFNEAMRRAVLVGLLARLADDAFYYKLLPIPYRACPIANKPRDCPLVMALVGPWR